jgi:hypothetical protein
MLPKKSVKWDTTCLKLCILNGADFGNSSAKLSVWFMIQVTFSSNHTSEKTLTGEQALTYDKHKDKILPSFCIQLSETKLAESENRVRRNLFNHKSIFLQRLNTQNLSDDHDRTSLQ